MSYCCECIENVHPKRGALATHQLVEGKDFDNQNQALPLQRNETNTTGLFCPICDKLVYSDNCGHDCIAMEDGRQKKLVSINNETYTFMFVYNK